MPGIIIFLLLINLECKFRKTSDGSPGHEGKAPYSPTQRLQSGFSGSPGPPGSYNYPPGSPPSTSGNTASKGKDADVDVWSSELFYCVLC